MLSARARARVGDVIFPFPLTFIALAITFNLNLARRAVILPRKASRGRFRDRDFSR